MPLELLDRGVGILPPMSSCPTQDRHEQWRSAPASSTRLASTSALRGGAPHTTQPRTHPNPTVQSWAVRHSCPLGGRSGYSASRNPPFRCNRSFRPSLGPTRLLSLVSRSNESERPISATNSDDPRFHVASKGFLNYRTSAAEVACFRLTRRALAASPRTVTRPAVTAWICAAR